MSIADLQMSSLVPPSWFPMGAVRLRQRCLALSDHLTLLFGHSQDADVQGVYRLALALVEGAIVQRIHQRQERTLQERASLRVMSM